MSLSRFYPWHIHSIWLWLALASFGRTSDQRSPEVREIGEEKGGEGHSIAATTAIEDLSRGRWRSRSPEKRAQKARFRISSAPPPGLWRLAVVFVLAGG